MCREDQAVFRITLHEMWKTGEDGRRVLCGLPEGAIISQREEAFFLMERSGGSHWSDLNIMDAGNTVIFMQKP